MGILNELFSFPVYGRNGARGDVTIPVEEHVVGYGKKPTSAYSPMAAAKIRQRQREAQRRYAERRRQANPAENAKRIVELLGTGAMSRTDLLTRLALDSPSFQAAADHALEAGLVDVHEYPANPKGGGRTAQRWSLRQQEPTQASRYWLQAPPGGAQLGGRPYRSGQFIPGTTMFTHTPQNKRPKAPVPYATQEEFEERIRENPTDATVHEVYADWFQEQGMEEEALFRRDLASLLRAEYPDGHDKRSIPWVLPPQQYLPEPFRGVEVAQHHFDPDEDLPRSWGGGLYWPSWVNMFSGLRRAWNSSRQKTATQNSRAANYGPVPYAPLPEPQQSDPTQTGVAPQPDGTWAMPTPPTAGQGVQGAPQTVGGVAMFPQSGSPPIAPQSPQSNPSGLAVAAPPPVRPDPNTPQLVRTPGLSHEDMILEAQTQQFAWANYPALRDMYFQTNAVLDPVSGDVRSLRIDADAWRELLPGYNGTNATATHAAAVYLNAQLFKEALQNQAGKGNNRMMVLAGGGGSGKGTAVNQFLEMAEFPLILDQTSRDYGKLAGQFEAARAAGMQPSYLFVDRPAPYALHGAVERAIAEIRQGRPARTVPLEMLARTNIDARRVALQVLFAQPDVDAQVIDNRSTERFQRRMITDRNEAAQYLAHRLREDEDALNSGVLEQLRNDILARHKKGEIPVNLVSGFLEPGWHIRPPVPLNSQHQG